MTTINFPLRSPPHSLQKLEALKKVDNLVKGSSENIYQASSVFPFDFFPDHITVNRSRVDIIIGMFIATKEMISILIENIYEVDIDYSLFFASINFKVTGNLQNPPPIGFLKKDEAIKLRRIISGLVLALKEKIDIKELTVQELQITMEQIGKVQHK